MKLIDTYEINNQIAVYTVSLEPGFNVDVKVFSDTGLVYVMQNADGSTVYDQDSSECTFPDYKYNEEDVIRFVKETINRQDEKEVNISLDDMMNRASARLKHDAQQAMVELDKQISFSEPKR